MFIVLSPVTIFSTWDQEALVNELYDVLLYNRSKNDIFKAKCNVLLTSHIDSLPLERIESIGNLYIKNGGVDEYFHRMGRFGQNAENNFFTLSIESILNNFKLFDTPSENIPLLITQLNKKQIKSRYNLSQYDLSAELSKIAFDSKSPNQFSGFLIFNRGKDIVSIHLSIADLPPGFIESIYRDQSIAMKSMEYDFVFNEQVNQPSYINLKYGFEYDFQDGKKRNISTNISIAVNELGITYPNALINTQKFNKLTDYQQIIMVPFDSVFWGRNYVYVYNQEDVLSLNYFKNHGYVTNYQRYQSNSTIRPLLTGMLKWEEEGFRVIICLNTSGSYYFLPKDLFGEIAINLYLDTFEKNRKELESILVRSGDAEDKISQINMTFQQSRKEADDHLRKCERGSKLDQLLLWNQKIDSSLNTDRIATLLKGLVSGFSDTDFSKVNLFEQCASIGSEYYKIRECNKAKICFEQSLTFKEEVPQKRLGKLYFDLGVTCVCLDEPEQACLSFRNAQLYGQKVPLKLMNKVCE